MDKKTKTARLIIFALIIVGIVVVMRLVVRATMAGSKYDTFAQCLVSKKVAFYGAFWCPHCQAQERALNATRQKLEAEGLYKECSTPDGKSQTQICIDNNVTGYPTWVFPDGSRVSGEQSLSTLAEKSGCPLAQDSSSSVTTGAASSAQ